MTFPVFHTTFEVLHGCLVLRSPLLLVDPVCDALGGGDTRFKLLEIRVLFLAIEDLYETLRTSVSEKESKSTRKHTSSRSGYLQMRCTGLMRKAGSSDFTLRMWSRAY